MIFVSDSAKRRIEEIRRKDALGPDHFVRVAVTSGGCSGLTYQLTFDDQLAEGDQVFEDNGEKVVTNLRSYLYLHKTTL